MSNSYTEGVTYTNNTVSKEAGSIAPEKLELFLPDITHSGLAV